MSFVHHGLSSGHGNLKEIEEAVGEQSTSRQIFLILWDIRAWFTIFHSFTLNLQPSNTSSNAMLDSKEQPCGLLPLERAYCAK